MYVKLENKYIYREKWVPNPFCLYKQFENKYLKNVVTLRKRLEYSPCSTSANGWWCKTMNQTIDIL